MNKFEKWNIESKIENIFNLKEKKENLEISDKIAQKLKEKYFLKNKEIISKYNKNFKIVQKFSFENSEEKVFFGEDRDSLSENDLEKGYLGLKKQQIFFSKNYKKDLENGKKNKNFFLEKAICLVDNHNNSLFYFYEIFDIINKNNIKNKKIEIIHIDAHRDNAIFQFNYPEKVDYENINYFLKKTRVSDYLDFALKTKIIDNVKNITQSFEFDDFLENSKNKKNDNDIAKENICILSLDIDIFGEEGGAVDFEVKIKAIKKAWEKANAVVIATSPGFIEDKKAKFLIEKIIENI